MLSRYAILLNITTVEDNTYIKLLGDLRQSPTLPNPHCNKPDRMQPKCELLWLNFCFKQSTAGTLPKLYKNTPVYLWLLPAPLGTEPVEMHPQAAQLLFQKDCCPIKNQFSSHSGITLAPDRQHLFWNAISFRDSLLPLHCKCRGSFI